MTAALPKVQRPVRERPAQPRDVKAETALIDRYIGPDPCDQIPVTDDLAGMLDKKNENI